MRSPSWAFIWQPNVVTWYRLIGASLGQRTRLRFAAEPVHEPSPLPPDAEPAELGAHLGGLGFHAYVGEVLPDDSYRGVWASPGLGTLVGEPFGTPGSSLAGRLGGVHPPGRPQPLRRGLPLRRARRRRRLRDPLPPDRPRRCAAHRARALPRAPRRRAHPDRGRDRGGRGPARVSSTSWPRRTTTWSGSRLPSARPTTPPSWTTAATGASSTPARAGRRCSGASRRAASRSPTRCGARSCRTTASASTTTCTRSRAARAPRSGCASPRPQASAGSRVVPSPGSGTPAASWPRACSWTSRSACAPRTSCAPPARRCRASRRGPTRSSTPTSSSRTAATRCSCPSPATRA